MPACLHVATRHDNERWCCRAGSARRSFDIFENRDTMARMRSFIKQPLKDVKNVYTQHTPLLQVPAAPSRCRCPPVCVCAMCTFFTGRWRGRRSLPTSLVGNLTQPFSQPWEVTASSSYRPMRAGCFCPW